MILLVLACAVKCVSREPTHAKCTTAPEIRTRHLQLGLGLRFLEDGVQLGRLHDVALDLKLARHE